MVSTRHHPRPFPPAPEPTSPQSSTSRHNPEPETPTSTTSSSRTISFSPTQKNPSTVRSRSQSRKRKPTTSSPKDEEEKQPIMSGLTRTPATQKQNLIRSTSTKPKTSKTHSASLYTHTPPPLLIPWLLLSLPLVVWDTLYILLRPHTMPGGSLHSPIWTPYALYGRIDYIYGLPAWESQNGFTAAQGTMNALETACYIYYLFIVTKRAITGNGFIRGVALKSFNAFARRDGNERDKIVVSGDTDVAGAVVLLFVTLVLTSAKTVLYVLNEHYSGWKHVGHNFGDPVRLIVLWIIPNSPWIFVPAVLGWVIGKEIVEAMCTAKGGGRENVVDGTKR